MKLLAFFAVFLLFVNLSVQLPQFVNCPRDFVPPSSIANNCERYTCNDTTIFGVGCATSFCLPGKESGYTVADNSKVFPDCCSKPICEA